MRAVFLALVAAVSFSSCSSTLPQRLTFEGVEATMWQGSDHCGWDDTWYVELTDDRFDIEVENGRPVYVRNPEGMAGSGFKYAADPDLEAEVPSSAMLIGEGGGFELWFDQADHALIYLVDDTSVEAWALSVNFTGCA